MQDHDQNDSGLQVPDKIIPDDQRASLRQMLDAMPGSVELHTYVDQEIMDAGGGHNKALLTRFTLQITSELAECSAKIRTVRHGAAEAASLSGPAGLPSLCIRAVGAQHFALRMVGAPLGQEGAALIKVIRMVGSGDNELSRAARQSLAQVTGPRAIMVFGADSCPYCPGQIALAAAFALERPGLISACSISVGEFPDLAKAYGVGGVPHTVVNERHSLVGLQQDAPFAAFVLNPGGAAAPKFDADQAFNPGDDAIFGGAEFGQTPTAAQDTQKTPDAAQDTKKTLTAADPQAVLKTPDAAPAAPDMSFASGIGAAGTSGGDSKTGMAAGQLGVVRDKGDEFNCDLLILGGGPAGLTAAVYAARSGLSVTLLDSGLLGGQVQLTPLVENYPGFKGLSGSSLAESMVEHARQYAHLRGNLQIINLQRLNLGQPEQPEAGKAPDGRAEQNAAGGYFVASTSNGEYRGRALLFATGSSWRKLGIPGELVFAGRGVHNCASCDGYIYAGKKVVVIGGGNAALTDALHLRNLGIDVSIIHRRDQFRGEDALAEAVLRSGVKVFWDSAPLEILGRDKLSGLKVKNLKTGAEQVLEADGVFVCVGHEPNSRPAKAVGAALNPDGSIAVDAQMRASVPLVYAAGDVTGGFLQIVTAVAKGAQAAHSAFVDLQQKIII